MTIHDSSQANEKYGSARFRWSEFEDFFEGFKLTLNDSEHVHLTNVIMDEFERKFKERCKVVPPWLKHE